MRNLAEIVWILAKLECGGPFGGFVVGHECSHGAESSPCVLVVSIRRGGASEFEETGEIGDLFNSDAIVAECKYTCVCINNVKSPLDPGCFSFGDRVV